MNKLNEHIGETVTCTYTISSEVDTIIGMLKAATDSTVLIKNICLPLNGEHIKVNKIASISGVTYYDRYLDSKPLKKTYLKNK